MSQAHEIPAALRIQPPRRNPFYIVSPDYTRQSAGIKALHLLCHALNRTGHSAFIVRQNFFEVTPFKKTEVHPDLLTPPLTRAAYDHHLEQGLVPIVVYPEVISGNPLNAAVVVRYVLNFPGLLGGDKVYAPEEFVIAYSKKLADAAGVGADRVLFIPASDTNIFYRGPEGSPRSGTCFYADKYRKVHNGQLLPVTEGSTEITRGIGSQTPTEVAELLRRSELFYTYENSAIAIEAILCGCPTVFLPNAHLTEIIASEELGTEGYAWGDSPEEIERAKATVDIAFDNYVRNYERFWQQLERFAKQALALAEAAAASGAVARMQTEKLGEKHDVSAAPSPAPAISMDVARGNRVMYWLDKSGVLKRPERILLAFVYVALLYGAYWLGGRP